MAGMKSWLEKIKNRILKKDLDTDLLKSKIQSKEKLKEKALPDLITPTNEEINQEKNEIQREEAIRVKKVNEREKIQKNQIVQMQMNKGSNKGFVHLTDVPKRTRKA